MTAQRSTGNNRSEMRFHKLHPEDSSKSLWSLPEQNNSDCFAELEYARH
jgi:hypothetical protein